MAEIQNDPAPQEQETPGQPVGQIGGDPMKMHKLALTAEQALEGLATEMGKANAPEPVIKAVSSMAGAMRKILSAMAKAPTPAAPAQPEQRPTIASATNELAANARQQ
jgi:phage I-like protein